MQRILLNGIIMSCILLPALVQAAPHVTMKELLRIPERRQETVTMTVPLPSFSCGTQGRSPNICQLGGIIQARGPVTVTGPVRYYCMVNYSYVSPNSTKRLQITPYNNVNMPDQPSTPGVLTREDSSQLFDEKNIRQQSGITLSQDAPIRFKGKAIQHSVLNLTRGRGEQSLSDGQPLTLPEHVNQAELEEISCYQE